VALATAKRNQSTLSPTRPRATGSPGGGPSTCTTMLGCWAPRGGHATAILTAYPPIKAGRRPESKFGDRSQPGYMRPAQSRGGARGRTEVAAEAGVGRQGPAEARGAPPPRTRAELKQEESSLNQSFASGIRRTAEFPACPNLLPDEK
jgi:hypothetical protein